MFPQFLRHNDISFECGRFELCTEFFRFAEVLTLFGVVYIAILFVQADDYNQNDGARESTPLLVLEIIDGQGVVVHSGPI